MTDFANFQTVAADLVKRFESDIAQGLSYEYDEATLRIQFLNRLFGALGWDVSNTQGLPAHLCEVVVESRTDIAGRKKRADYLFRVGGINKLVAEAKRPSEFLKRHAFQIQNYTYNLRLYLGVLTNFEYLELHVVGARPDKDTPFEPVRTYHFSDFAARAREIWDLFARENVKNGSIERFLQDLPKGSSRTRQGWLFKPTKTKTVDEDFLEFLDQFRERLAESLFVQNPKRQWGETGLNEAVQRIIDRILFIRICEDRDIDTGQPLAECVGEWRSGGARKGQLYPRLVAQVRRLAPVFNGGLFGKPGEEPHFSDFLHVDDGVLADFVEDISGDESSYLFNTIPVEILGSVYERFLGKIIRLTA